MIKILKNFNICLTEPKIIQVMDIFILDNGKMSFVVYHLKYVTLKRSNFCGFVSYVNKMKNNKMNEKW